MGRYWGCPTSVPSSSAHRNGNLSCCFLRAYEAGFSTVQTEAQMGPPMLFRRTTEEVKLAGIPIAAASPVFLLTTSAHRDDQKFADPDRFDIGRNHRDHLAFGNGIHYCLGAKLARLEVKIALGGVLFGWQTFSRKAEDVEWIDAPALRGLKTLPLAFEAA